jgi:hypothetical protein
VVRFTAEGSTRALELAFWLSTRGVTNDNCVCKFSKGAPWGTQAGGVQ